MWGNALYLLAGLTVLIIGGEYLVRGAVKIAKRAKIAPLVIGMTVVSFGTSAPELIVSVNAALEGVPEIAVGNVIGSNIANLALVLGLTTMIFPIIVDKNSIFIDWPMMMFASALFFLFAFDTTVVLWEGIILFSLLIAFTSWIIIRSRRKGKLDVNLSREAEDSPVRPLYVSLLFLLVGIAGLYFGSEWLLAGAVGIAEDMGMEKHLIAVTIVAFGTSVPELVTSGMAAFRKQTDISVGSLIGSNIFNIMAVIALTSIVKPIDVEKSVIGNDMIWMLGIALMLFPLMFFGRKLTRVKGVVLFLTYVAYITMLVLTSRPEI